ncbi:MAG: hypothetical protein COU27_02470 [Candidatus Levybacteria bacterium CG10_big_fil_rev_8_21_14_0_10_36_7]|nr:MAG: hypothetical protein COU27_02470 [Candidatus Levybacteria bacterium CG10_big_fil_rev_8_21_14_0_10_36_7]
MSFEIIPGILEKEWSEIERKIEEVKDFAKVIHIDIIDGKFAENTTFLDPKPFSKYTNTFTFELHMMVENPIEYLKPWAEVGFKRFYGHIEKMDDQNEFVTLGQTLGEVGLALNGPTPISEIKVALNEIDSVLIYTAQAVGFSGASFQDNRLEKVKEIRAKSTINIEVDGGINSEVIKKAQSAGADRFASTGFLFKKNPHDQYLSLKNSLDKNSAQ